MKSYRELCTKLPSNTVVVTYCSFDPPTNKHDLLVQFVRKIATLYNADALVFIHKTGIVPLNRRLQHLNVLYSSDIRFEPIDDVSANQALLRLPKRYSNLIVVSNSIEKLDVVNRFDTVKVINISPYIDFDQYSDLVIKDALVGDFDNFKGKLPLKTRTIDARRIMNDIRVFYNLDELPFDVNIPFDYLRDQYINKKIFNEGDVVLINGQHMTISFRGTNYVVLTDDKLNTTKKFIQDILNEQAYKF